jgi:hypothetical protein
LTDLFQQYTAGYEAKKDAYTDIWSIVEPILSPHNRNFASNIELLRKSKEDIRIDTVLCKTIQISQDPFDSDIDNIEAINLDLDTKKTLHSLDKSFSTESLIAAYYSITASWCKERITAGQRIHTLLQSSNRQVPCSEAWCCLLAWASSSRSM